MKIWECCGACISRGSRCEAPEDFWAFTGWKMSRLGANHDSKAPSAPLSLACHAGKIAENCRKVSKFVKLQYLLCFGYIVCPQPTIEFTEGIRAPRESFGKISVPERVSKHEVCQQRAHQHQPRSKKSYTGRKAASFCDLGWMLPQNNGADQ